MITIGLFTSLTQILAPLVLAGIGLLTQKSTAWVKEKTAKERQEQVDAVLRWVDNLIQTAVKAAYQVVVSKFQREDPTKPLTAEQAKKAKDFAWDTFKKSAGNQMIEAALKILGIAKDRFDNMVDAKIEAAVLNDKMDRANTDAAIIAAGGLPPFRMGSPTPQPSSGKLEIKK